MDWWVDLLRYWGKLIPSVKTLVVMIGLDIAAGWLVAIAKHTLNSTTSFAGICKKAMVLLLVTVAIILEPYANGLPISMLIALGFIGMEGISIAENAAVLGVPLPPQLLQILEKFQNSKEDKLSQKSGSKAAIERNTAALQMRIEQTETALKQPQPVIVTEPIQAEIVNTLEHPVNVKNKP